MNKPLISKLLMLVLMPLVLFNISLVFNSSVAYAKPADSGPTPAVTTAPAANSCDPTKQGTCPTCNGSRQSGYSKECLVCDDSANPQPNTVRCDEANASAYCGRNSCDLIQKYLNPTINLLSALIGIIAVISLIGGAIQFVASDGDPQKAAAARSRIAKTVFAFIAYLFLWAFFQFLVPGGIFK